MTRTAPNALDVVIVNWNGGALLRACLASLAAAEDDLGETLALRVVVVDNASRDGSLENLPSLRHGPAVIANPDNQGFGRACNAGAARGNAPAILFLNPDARVTGASLAGAHAALMAEAGTGIVGAQLRDEAGRVQRSCARRPSAVSLVGQALLLDRARLVPSHFMTEWDHGEDRAVDQVMGAFLMIRRSLFTALGGFDERFFVYYEDVDLCARAWDAGFACATSPASPCGTRARAPPGRPRPIGWPASSRARSATPPSITAGRRRWRSWRRPSARRCLCASSRRWRGCRCARPARPCAGRACSPGRCPA